mmetsp:Transcript_10509/g.13651  ORF Transcript_10509/g.13651 Transcript_10509/m.13651 type:complete len:390 (-) Transcript_10509:107-1276(-)
MEFLEAIIFIFFSFFALTSPFLVSMRNDMHHQSHNGVMMKAKKSATINQFEAEDVDKQVITVEDCSKSKRVDAFLSETFPEQSRSYFGSLCQQGLVLLDGKAAKKSVKVSSGQEVEVSFASTPELSVDAEEIPLDILYEDDHLIAIAKPPGMVVHPAPGSWNGTFVNALKFHLEQQGHAVSGEGLGGADDLRPGIVHRLDKGTSGVLVAAKNPICHAKLSEMFANRDIKKTYLAVCVGNPGKGVKIESLIGRHPKNRQKMTVLHETYGGGKLAISNVDTLSFDGQLSLAKVQIETGRTHQIRVHLSHRRTPVLGDEVYGNGDQNKRAIKRFGIDRPLLHAYSLEFDHPITGEPMTLEAPIPLDMANVLSKIYPQLAAESPEILLSTLAD